MQHLVDILHRTACSLVVEDKEGWIKCFYQKGVRDLMALLDCEPLRLKDAKVADKVIGKSAAWLLIRGDVGQVYADVMSRKAASLLTGSSVQYEYGAMVERITLREGDGCCPLEEIVAEASSAEEVERLLRKHFSQMKSTTNQ